MSTSYYLNGLIQILHFISDDLLQCDASTTIGELFDDDFDDLDFELALTCFEATYKVAIHESFWKAELDQFDELTLEEFLESQVDTNEQKDPLFVTKRFLFYEKSLTEALREEYEGPAPDSGQE